MTTARRVAALGQHLRPSSTRRGATTAPAASSDDTEVALHADAAQMGLTFERIDLEQPFVRVHGVDLTTAPLGDDSEHEPPTPLARLLRRAFVRFGLLLFRDQDSLQPADEVRVNKCLRFHDTSQEEFAFGQGKAVGKTTGLTSSAVLPDYPMVVVMGTAQLTDHFGVSGVELKQSLGYLTPGFHHDGLHEDGSHVPGGLAPPIVTTMFCHAAPDDSTPPPGEESRGATLFTSTEFALDDMPGDLRQRLDGAVAFYDNQNMGMSEGPTRDYERIGAMEMVDGFRKTFTNQAGLQESLSAAELESVLYSTDPSEGGAVHPLIRTIWEKGKVAKQSVYLSSFALNHIRLADGEVIGARESWAVAERILEKRCRVGVRYAHQWRSGDLVVWDNRQALHSVGQGSNHATETGAKDMRRLHHRVRLAGSAEDNYGPPGLAGHMGSPSVALPTTT